LQAGYSLHNDPLTPADASLSQIGLVPPGTRSISFLVGSHGVFTVSLGGVNLDPISIPVTNNLTLYRADASAFAGETVELRFTAVARVSELYLDDIQFSPEAIPEPSTLTLT